METLDTNSNAAIMDGDAETLEGQQPQCHLDDDQMFPEEELYQGDDTPQSQDGRMLLDNDSEAQTDSLTPFSDFEHEIPQYLPEKALLTCSSSLLRANGKQDTYLTIHNAPSNNYVAQKINDGNEFAVGGDPSHILKSLDREFKFQPQQRWHVIVISEDTLQFVGVPRRSYPLVSGMGDQSSQSAGEGFDLQQRRDSGGDSMMEDGPVSPTSRNQLNEQGRTLSRLDGAQQSNKLMNGEPVSDLSQVFDNPNCTSHGQFQQTNSIDKMVIDATNEPKTRLSDHQQTQSPLVYDFPQPSVMPHYTSPVQDHLSQPVAMPEHNKRKHPHQEPMHQTEEEQKQNIGDALFMAADHRFGNYAGTNLCRWCGRRGHEAVQCIRWDPEHFDKLVCIVCNNKKHLLDDCLRFQVMSEEEKVNLLLVDGANRPGARSLFWPWTHFVNNLNANSTTAAALPMTRAFIKRLTSTERGGNMWGNLWKTFPYGACEVPAAFHDKELVLDGLDECFDAHWPLMPRAGDLVSVSPAEQQLWVGVKR